MKVEFALQRAVAGTAPAVDFTGKWINELNSEMTLTQRAEVISGTYESTVSSTGRKTIGDLQGYANGDLISFIVHWREFQALTSWCGQINPKTKSIDTLWQMTKQVAEGEEWSSINAGADYFTRVSGK